MEENNIINLAYIKNLNPTTISVDFTIPVDINANVERVLNVDCSFNDRKVDVTSGKATISGKIVTKVVYLDADGILNTTCTSQNVSENIVNESITSNSFVQITNVSCSSNAIVSDNVLKVECRANVYLIETLNIGLKTCLDETNVISKKNQFQTYTFVEGLNTDFDYTLNFETKDQIVKILGYSACFNLEDVATKDNLLVISGTLIGKITYEIDGEIKIKTLKEKANIKQDIEIKNLQENDIVKLNVFVEKNCDDFEISTDEDQTISVKNKLSVSGIILRPVVLDLIDDAFSTTNNLNLSTCSRQFLSNINCKDSQIEISNEVVLNEDEAIVDEIISNVISSSEITNSYSKDGTIVVEGIITSNIVYLDENKNLNSKFVETPFCMDTKIESKKPAEICSNIVILNCQTKCRRGTTIEIDYDAKISICQFENENTNMIDNIEIGEPLNFGDYDFQIFIAKENETTWDLAKRIKISLETLTQTNPSLPLIMQGGEKVIIRR